MERIIDANLNRAKEGLRVCEEVARFIISDKGLTLKFKKTRHSIDSLAEKLLRGQTILNKRDSLADVGKDISAGELKRKDHRDIFFANIQRVKESIRVLEEFSKLKDTKLALGFKKIRYNVYALEKKAASKLPALRNIR